MISKSGAWLSSKYEGHIFDSQLATGIALLFKEYNINSYWDIGCGPGTYIQFLNEYGFNGMGLDGNPNCESDICLLKDLSLPLDLEKREASICIEVGEHIPAIYEKTFIDNLKSSFSSLLILSWATPGQEGIGHFNCKERAEVMKMFPEYNYNSSLTTELAANCEHWYLSKNLMVFNSL